MTSAQTQLYFRAWHAAAKAHGWTTKAGVAAALAAHHAGEVWQSPELDRLLSAIYQLALSIAEREQREVCVDDLRPACAVAALGRQVSSKTFTNAEFDQVLALLRLLADPQNLKNLIAFQNCAADGERRRHVHQITRAPEPYWKRIAADRFGHTDLDRLTLDQLRQLSLTLRNRRAVASPLSPQPELVPA